MLCVNKGYRNQGIGTSLLKESEDYIKKQGYKEVNIGVGYDYLMPGVPTNKMVYEEALEKFKEAVAKESSFDGININQVVFEYTLVNEYVDGELIAIAVPCWHFYREVPSWMGYSEVDVVVNAITGAATIL